MKLYISSNKNSREFAKMCVREYTGETRFAFAENEFGKPFIIGMDENVHFSLSHSGDILICAVARFNIGADCQVVNIKKTAKCRKIAERFYSPQENLFLNGLPEAGYVNNFFEIWAKKEAYIKYTGRGLSEGLSTFSVTEHGLSLCGVCFKRAAPELPGAYIYLCCGAADAHEFDGLQVVCT